MLTKTPDDSDGSGRLRPITPEITDLRRSFIRTIASNQELTDRYLNSLLADVWPVYRALPAVDTFSRSAWSFIRQSCPAVNPHLLPLKEKLIEWAKSNHLIDTSDAPAEWIMDVALSLFMLKRWGLQPQFERKLLLTALPGEIKHPDSSYLSKKFTMTVDWNGERLELYENRIREEFEQALRGHLADVGMVAEPNAQLKEKRSLATHLEWLAQNLLLGRSAAEIVAHACYRVGISSVSEAIRDVAAMLELKPRRSKGGRPRRTLKATKATK